MKEEFILAIIISKVSWFSVLAKIWGTIILRPIHIGENGLVALPIVIPPLSLSLGTHSPLATTNCKPYIPAQQSGILDFVVPVLGIIVQKISKILLARKSDDTIYKYLLLCGKCSGVGARSGSGIVLRR